MAGQKGNEQTSLPGHQRGRSRHGLAPVPFAAFVRGREGDLLLRAPEPPLPGQPCHVGGLRRLPLVAAAAAGRIPAGARDLACKAGRALPVPGRRVGVARVSIVLRLGAGAGFRMPPPTAPRDNAARVRKLPAFRGPLSGGVGHVSNVAEVWGTFPTCRRCGARFQRGGGVGHVSNVPEVWGTFSTCLQTGTLKTCRHVPGGAIAAFFEVLS